MKARFQVKALNAALEAASLVEPTSLEDVSGYLFVVKDNECSVYSRGDFRQIRVSLPTESSDGDGSFVLPSKRVAALKHLDGWVSIESGVTDGRHWLRYEAESEEAEEDLSTLDPRMIQSLEPSLNKATPGSEFSPKILLRALETVERYITPNSKNGEEHNKTILIFDKTKEGQEKGDGVMFGSDGLRTCHFYCDKFKDKSFVIHGQHIPTLKKFLAKAEGSAQLRHGNGISFVVSGGSVLGWSHSTKTHSKFTYYPHKSDQFVFRLDKDLCMKALDYARAVIPDKKYKARLQYSHEKSALTILPSEAKAHSRTIPVRAEVDEASGAGSKGNTESFAVNLSIDHLIDLIRPMVSHQIELRIFVNTSGKKESALIRTMDHFHLSKDGAVLVSEKDVPEDEAAKCQVVRYMPSME